MSSFSARRIASRYCRNMLAAAAVTAVFALLAAGERPDAPGALVAIAD